MATPFKTQFNHNPEKHLGEWNDEESLTQPDEVLSLSEILLNHTRGMPVTGTKDDPRYYPEDLGYVPHPDELDLVERQEYVDNLEKLLNEKHAELEKKEKELKEQQERDAKEYEEMRAHWLKTKETPPPSPPAAD